MGTTDDFQEWLASLSGVERDALRAYKDSTENLKALIFNQPQDAPSNNPNWKWTDDHVKALDSAIAKLKHSPATLWCAVPNGSSVRKHIVDETYRFPAHISASRSQSAAYSFSAGPEVDDPILLKFFMNDSFIAAQLPLSSGTGDGEQELILPRNVAYEVIREADSIPFTKVKSGTPHKDKIVTIIELKPRTG
jgi:hypothetical protein